MKRRALFLCAPLLVLIGVLGCEDTGSVAGVGKPPPSGGGPREIAFIQNMSKQGVCIRAMAVDGSNVETIACHARGQSLLSVSWEPAGTAIAYTINSIPDYGLWRVNADGTNALRLLTQADCPGCGSVAWSPLGQEIAVISNEGNGTAALLLVPATGCPWPDSSDPCPRILYSKPTGAEIYFHGLAWSPDGTKLAMGDRRGPGNQFILLVEPGPGPGPGTVTEVGAVSGTITDWGRGDRAATLALSSQPDPNTSDWDIYFFDLSTPALPRQLVVQHGRDATFSPDGEFIAYRETSGLFWMVKRELDPGVRTVLLKANVGALNWRKPGS